MIYDIKAFGDLFSAIRHERHYSIQQLSDDSSISKRTLQLLEHGTHLVKLDTLSILSYYLDIDLVQLLLTCKDTPQKQLDQILDHFRRDCDQHHYHLIPDYLEQLYQLYSSKRYNINQISDTIFFNAIESSIFWLRGVHAMLYLKEHHRAEIYLMTGLSIRHTNLEIQDIPKHSFNMLELQILSSLIHNRIMSGHMNFCQELITYALEQIGFCHMPYAYLCLSLRYHLANIYLHQKQYQKAMDTVDQALAMTLLSPDAYDIGSFLYIRYICEYLLGDSQVNEKFKDLFAMYRVHGQGHLLPDLKESLRVDYALKIDE